MDLYSDHEFHIDNPNGEGIIAGSAFYDIDVENDFSSDIGGSDGRVLRNVSLHSVAIGGLILTEEQAQSAVGKDTLRAEVERISDLLTGMLDSGEDIPLDRIELPEAA